MVGDKIKYTCKNCGWWTAIREEWADLKPKRCMNKKCNNSFIKFPDSLIMQVPSGEQSAPAEPVKSPGRKGRKSEAENS